MTPLILIAISVFYCLVVTGLMPSHTRICSASEVFFNNIANVKKLM